ncbi:RNI-like protein [Gonapodya prolifera JEL478]|uniref:RNI-like protein n=1 Tax=Gonapodya prolifera (strain JEL478) TaxID=1344416 RepID=A0A139AVD5_GONPJ|nr:RNI-like protein [Gonapodya prolifera JEL478]|eukprot:KXS20692.1 RNI-like protein [Gonapodya prolifera JEL478]
MTGLAPTSRFSFQLPKFLAWRSSTSSEDDSSSEERITDNQDEALDQAEARRADGGASLDSIDLPADQPQPQTLIYKKPKPRTTILRSRRSTMNRPISPHKKHPTGPDLITPLPADVISRLIQHLDVVSRVRLSLTSRKWAATFSVEHLWTKIDAGDRILKHRLNGDTLAALAQRGGPGLRRVRLHSCYLLRDGDLNSLVDLAPNITKLSLSNSWNLTDGAITVVSRRCASLRELDLSYLGHLTGECFKEHSMQSLRRLDLSHCKNLQDDGVAQSLLPGTRDLAEIHLRRCIRLTEQTLYAMAKYCHELRVLDLGDCAFVTDRSLQWVAGSCHQLAALSVRFCGGITNAGIANLACVNPGQWEGLDLSFCTQVDRLESIGAEALSGLRSVFLRGCPQLTPQTAVWLARTAPRLERMDLTRCSKIGPEIKDMVAAARAEAAATARAEADIGGSGGAPSPIGYNPWLFGPCDVAVDLPPESRGVLSAEQRGVPRATEVPVEEMHTVPVRGRAGSSDAAAQVDKKRRKSRRRSGGGMD